MMFVLSAWVMGSSIRESYVVIRGFTTANVTPGICVSEANLMKAKKLLKHFYFKFSALYSERYLNCNLHQLLYLSDTVKDVGPLYTFSCFDHENCNGQGWFISTVVLIVRL